MLALEVDAQRTRAAAGARRLRGSRVSAAGRVAAPAASPPPRRVDSRPPLAVRIVCTSQSTMFAKTVWRIVSTECVGRHAPGPPVVVSASMQIAPPAVTCPVYQTKRGAMHRRKNLRPRPRPAKYPRGTRGGAATRLRGISTWHPRRPRASATYTRGRLLAPAPAGRPACRAPRFCPAASAASPRLSPPTWLSVARTWFDLRGARIQVPGDR